MHFMDILIPFPLEGSINASIFHFAPHDFPNLNKPSNLERFFPSYLWETILLTESEIKGEQGV